MRRHGISALFGALAVTLSGVAAAAQDARQLAARTICHLDLQTNMLCAMTGAGSPAPAPSNNGGSDAISATSEKGRKFRV